MPNTCTDVQRMFGLELHEDSAGYIMNLHQDSAGYRINLNGYFRGAQKQGTRYGLAVGSGVS